MSKVNSTYTYDSPHPHTHAKSHDNDASRRAILRRIREGLDRDTSHNEEVSSVTNRLKEHSRNTLPQRACTSGAHRRDTFVNMAEEASAEIIPLETMTHLPAQVATLVAKQDVTLRLANEPVLTQLDWQSIAYSHDVAQKGDTISLTTCLAGVAETGTLVLTSSATSPTSYNFLPDIHCVVLREEDIVASYEDAWDLVRAQDLPRTVNFITGPSRSADIEQKIQMGAHGPKRLIVFLLAKHEAFCACS